jgi:uncharacterized membrane protein YhaH (DUF805 family)
VADLGLRRLSFGVDGILSALFLVVAGVPYVAGCTKRCHDRDRSGWFLLRSLIPLVNVWVGVELGFLAGPPGPNRYSPPGDAGAVVDAPAPGGPR